ncbi:MAG: GatB/YqeY domain-containing protein [Gemmatimonadota bacterium]|nr:GatB/YqeY domain-containing protein [Gemmatimonadota bacterium]
MSQLLARLQRDLNDSRRSQNKPLTLLLGTALADVKNRRIELRRDLTDEDVQDVLRKASKRRREAAGQFDAAGRPDVGDRERNEAATLELYLPASAPDDEIRAAVAAAIVAGAGNIGAVMGKVMPQFKARADGSRINSIAREELSRRG